MADHSAFLGELRTYFGPDSCLETDAACRVYSRDASGLTLGRPLAIVLPSSHDQVVTTIRLCAQEGVPFVARGAGTGLSGGALPPDGSVVISLARLQHIDGADDPDRSTVLVGPGVTNAALGRKLARRGASFAPDPSSQEAATIGGNIATNAGGPHCLKVGMTLQHARSLRWVDPSGRTWSSRSDNLDLTPLLVGSEGILGIVTEAELVATPLDPSTITMLVYVSALETAARAVVELLGSGLLPAAMEVVDGPMLANVEKAFHFGFRTDAAAAMIIEFSGSVDKTAADANAAKNLLEKLGADVIPARSEKERTDLWRCRKKAFGALGRLSPNYVNMDVAVPLGRLPDMVRTIQETAVTKGVQIATALHAGDGNLHPGVLYDARDQDSCRRAHAAADRILEAALAFGGTVTGEHGVGLEKLDILPHQIEPIAMRLMQDVKAAFDPDGLCNPGKALPDLPGLAPVVDAPNGLVVRAEDSVLTAPTGSQIDDLRSEAQKCGFDLAGPSSGTLKSGLENNPLLRHEVVEVWARTGDDRPFHVGCPVVKNVAGLDLGRLICGTNESLATAQAVTLRMRPRGQASSALTGTCRTVDAPAPIEPLKALQQVFDPEGCLNNGDGK
jgi:glycolate oxidase